MAANNYGKRLDGKPKGNGWKGAIPVKNGVMTEKSISVDFDGKKHSIPSIVPATTKKELESIQKNRITKSITDKAVRHARKRLKNKKSPFKQKNER